MNKIILMIVGLSSLVWSDFWRDPTTGIVIDTQRHFQWQDDYADNADAIKEADWEGAIEYCEDLVLGVHDDWRLPNETELLTLVDYAQETTAISSEFTHVSSSKNFWSSTSDGHNYAYLVYSAVGHTVSTGKSSASNAVRCIRGGRASL